ncbi:MAG: tetratricopeptide repeat protein [Acidimicrobiia bacterium]|jgi:tetratricopeptide (TPR) repeat protein
MHEYEAFTAFQEGSHLLSTSSPHAAATVLERARDLEPRQASIREALARAYYSTGRVRDAEAEFEAALEIDPVNDYAHFGLGLCRLKTGDRARARGHLRLAVAMRPEPEYRRALERASEGAA